MINTAKTILFYLYTNTNLPVLLNPTIWNSHNINLRFGSKVTEKFVVDSKITLVKQVLKIYSRQVKVLITRWDICMYSEKPPYRGHETFEYVNAAGQVRQHGWRWNDNGTGNPYWHEIVSYSTKQLENNWYAQPEILFIKRSGLFRRGLLSMLLQSVGA